jgi:Mycotoxin biosynthesis protein UstYa
MCSENPGLITYEWHPKIRGPVPVFRVERECVDWATLDAWAASQKVDIYDQVAVVHPVLGKRLVFGRGPDKANE